jgi:hypothetical protein
VHGFPHTTTTAPINSISFYKTESVFPTALTHNFHTLAIRTHTQLANAN